MKSITLHRAAADNTGGFQDAGIELKVGAEHKAGVIDAARAKALIESHGAVIGSPPEADKASD